MRADRKDEDFYPEMPPVDADYLLAYLFEIGPVVAVGMGAGPVAHEELQAWQRNTGIELDAWEARTLRRLSCDYLAELHAAEKVDRAAPWQPVDKAADLAAVANNMMNAIRAMAGE